MVPTPGKRLLTKDQDRLFERISTICVVHSALGIATLTRLGKNTTFELGDHTTVECLQARAGISIPIYGPFERALHNKQHTEIELEVVKPYQVSPLVELLAPRGGPVLRHVILRTISSVFVEFFESSHDWLRANIGHRTTWPATIQFGWAVRNAIAHGAKVSFTNAKDRPVSWYGLSYGSDQNGHDLYSDFVFGDFLLLMIEMSDELDALNCPTL